MRWSFRDQELSKEKKVERSFSFVPNSKGGFSITIIAFLSRVSFPRSQNSPSSQRIPTDYRVHSNEGATIFLFFHAAFLLFFFPFFFFFATPTISCPPSFPSSPIAPSFFESPAVTLVPWEDSCCATTAGRGVCRFWNRAIKARLNASNRFRNTVERVLNLIH